MEPLRQPAALRGQVLDLLGGLDALGDHLVAAGVARRSIAAKILVVCGSSGTSRRNERSILMTWTGSSRSRHSEE